MFYDADIFADWPADEDPPKGIAAFLIWLQLWWELFWEERDAIRLAPPLPLIRNRQDMRNAAHDARRAFSSWTG